MSRLNFEHFVLARSALGQKQAAAKFMSAGRASHASGADAAEMNATPNGEADAPPLVYHLTYCDSAGSETTRIVNLRRIEVARDSLYLVCMCHLRNEPRSFHVDRIREVFDASTGEVHERPRDFFASHPLLTQPRDPEDAAVKNCQRELVLLTMVGAADGLFDEDEQDHVLVHVYDRNLDLQLDEQRLRQRLALFAPDERAFWTSLHQMSRFKLGDARMTLRTMRRIVEADARLTPEEQAFVEEIQGRLHSLAAS